MYVNILSIIVLSCFVACTSNRNGDQIQTFQKENELLVVRVTAFRKETNFGGTLAGANYIFEARKKKNELEWREIMIFSDDAPKAINEDCIQFVNERIVYVYKGWMYAVTTDGGETWSVWNGFKYPLDKGRIGFNAIQNVKLLENGEGTMMLKLIANDDPIVLRTKNFGISWIKD